MSNVYFVFQKPESAYHDLPFERYDFPVSIPNGRNLTTGDLVVFDLTSKGAQLINGNKELRLTGFGVVGEIIEYQTDEGEIRRIATYSWHHKFNVALGFKDFGSDDLKVNAQHSICAIKNDMVVDFMINLLKLISK
jgi:hypothetical protein